MSSAAPQWAGDAEALRELQASLAGQVELRDRFAQPLRSIAGFEVGSEDEGATVRAVAVLMDADTLAVLDRQTARRPASMPALPGLRSFRELPALLDVLAMLRHAPDLAFVRGHGSAHPQRFGIAAHFGVASGVPSIGVATSTLTGEARMALHEMRGAFTPLRDGRQQIGWLLRSRPDCEPLVVSPGHRVAMAAAPELVMRFATGNRLPEPLRLAGTQASPMA
ncbi:endonuclease V [Thermomonas sp. XSG]|uniref:endonuclease V n=1 Tax=Thermomonas sp. XSG TaxID=2771436 RepID=UPI001680C36A|nr:endonuclease V [Thermomonas sp. XSG]QNU15707.1 endonuclease V [Thermomonas sp. XSG]